MQKGETMALLGTNGAGKSTVARCLAGISGYDCTAKSLSLNRKNLLKLTCDERAKAGLFLSWQDPVAIPGLSISDILRSALEARGQKISLRDFRILLAEAAEKLDLNPLATQRDTSAGFSGGEKKKLEILQMLILNPSLVILDEIDSGLDIDATRKISQILADYQKETAASFIVISHNFRIFESLEITQAIMLEDGRIADTGGAELIERVRRRGFRK